jgi:hypothetical protein
VGPALSPAVHGTRSFFRSIVWIHTLGQTIGGVCLGALAAGLGMIVTAVGPAFALALAVAIAAYSLSEPLPWTLWRPSRSWQVPEHYRRTPYVRTMAFLWGLALGIGWLTITTTPFVISFLGMLAAPPAVAIGAGATFGLARGLTLLLGVGAKDFEHVVARFAASARRLRTMGLVSAALGLALAVAVASN